MEYFTKNEDFATVYWHVLSLYNQGYSPTTLYFKVRQGIPEYFEEDDTKDISYCALAYALNELKGMNQELLDRVVAIVNQMIEKHPGNSVISEQLIFFLDTISKEPIKALPRKKIKYDIQYKLLVQERSPDGLKTIDVMEEYIDFIYKGTSAVIHWQDGGGGLFGYKAKGKGVEINWVDNFNVDINFDSSIDIKNSIEKYQLYNEIINFNYKSLQNHERNL